MPERTELIRLYQQKADLGTQAISEGWVVGNPYVNPDYREQRYAISAVAFRFQGPVAKLLSWSSREILSVEPTAHFVPPADLHIDFNVLAIYEQSRRDVGIIAKDLCSQKEALCETFVVPGDPMKLELGQVVACADQEGTSPTSITIAALFWPINERLDEVRREIHANTIYPFVHRSKKLDIIHASLARLTQPPSRMRDYIPLLETLEAINQHLNDLPAEQKCLTLTEFDLISTTRSRCGFYAADYVTVGDPISLVSPNPLSTRFKSIKPTLQSSGGGQE